MPRHTRPQPPNHTLDQLLAATPACPVDCACHTSPYTPCDTPGGCGSHGCGKPHPTTPPTPENSTTPQDTETRYCASPNRDDGRPTCRAYDHTNHHPAIVADDTRYTRDLFCTPCLTAYTRDIRMLAWDWLDLEQLQLPTLSQALDVERTTRPGPPMPLAANPEALQAEIHHATLTWETQLRIHQHTKRRVTLIIGAWHTTKTNPPPPARTRPGRDVQRAANYLATHIPTLTQLPPTPTRRTGTTDPIEPLTGIDAVLHLTTLHTRARSMLGRTHRTTSVPGSCSTCGWALWRDEPRYQHDPCDHIYCSNPTCDATWTHQEYQRFVGLELALYRHNPRHTAVNHQ